MSGEHEHEWIELTTWDDLPDRIWMCNRHPGEQQRETVDLATWLPQKLADDRRAYEAMGVQVVGQGPPDRSTPAFSPYFLGDSSGRLIREVSPEEYERLRSAREE